MKVVFGNSFSFDKMIGRQAANQQPKRFPMSSNLTLKPLFQQPGLFRQEEKQQTAPPIPSSIDQLMRERMDRDNILRKIARGDALTPAEQEELKQMDPMEVRKAEMASRQRKELERKLKNAKTEKEARDLITEAKANAYHVGTGPYKDAKYSSLLLEGIHEAERKYGPGAGKNREVQQEKENQ